MSAAELLDGADEIYEELEELYQEKRSLEQEILENHQKVEDGVVMALYKIQDELEPGDTYVLMESLEHGRNGSYSFEEVLTPEGIRAANIRHGGTNPSREELISWPDYEEPFDIETEYLTGRRDTPGFLRKIHHSITGEEVPESSFFYD